VVRHPLTAHPLTCVPMCLAMVMHLHISHILAPAYLTHFVPLMCPPPPTGSANFSKGSLGTPMLRHPLTALTGSLAVDGDTLAVSGLEAKVGPKGTLAIRGSLPLMPNGNGSNSTSRGGVDSRLHAVASGVELRARNMYSGILDADLDLRGSLAAPVLGGRVVFSKGTAFLVPPAGGSSGPDAAAAAAPANSSSRSQAELVRTAFAALKAGRARAATAAAATAAVDTRGVSGWALGVVGS
jgi:hypothetical protein